MGPNFTPAPPLCQLTLKDMNDRRNDCLEDVKRSDKAIIDMLVADMLVADMLPFSVVEGEAFKHLNLQILPEYDAIS